MSNGYKTTKSDRPFWNASRSGKKAISIEDMKAWRVEELSKTDWKRVDVSG